MSFYDSSQTTPGPHTSRGDCICVAPSLTLLPRFSRRLPIPSVSQAFLGQAVLSANAFQAYGKAVGQLNEMSSGLLSMLDAQSFITGLPAYFQHVLALFETCKAFAYAAEFAQ